MDFIKKYWVQISFGDYRAVGRLRYRLSLVSSPRILVSSALSEFSESQSRILFLRRHLPASKHACSTAVPLRASHWES